MLHRQRKVLRSLPIVLHIQSAVSYFWVLRLRFGVKRLPFVQKVFHFSPLFGDGLINIIDGGGENPHHHFHAYDHQGRVNVFLRDGGFYLENGLNRLCTHDDFRQ